MKMSNTLLLFFFLSSSLQNTCELNERRDYVEHYYCDDVRHYAKAKNRHSPHTRTYVVCGQKIKRIKFYDFCIYEIL